MADSSFTFWSNMKETIDRYSNFPEYQLKLYDALTEYGLYGTWPEDDGTKESADLIAFVQGMVPSLDKSRNFTQKCTESGSVGGKNTLYSDENIIKSIQEAAKVKGKVPSRKDVANMYKQLFGGSLCEKTITRRFGDEKKKEIAESYLRDISNVPGTENMSQGHKETLETDEGHNDMSQGQAETNDMSQGHKNDVPKNNTSFNF